MHYAAGVHHPAKRRPEDGLSLVPPRSALWMNAHGRRIGPMPLVGYTDTRHLAIRGRSNGGLLMGVAMTQHPEMFGAIWCGYPLLDMLR